MADAKTVQECRICMMRVEWFSKSYRDDDLRKKLRRKSVG